MPPRQLVDAIVEAVEKSPNPTRRIDNKAELLKRIGASTATVARVAFIARIATNADYPDDLRNFGHELLDLARAEKISLSSMELHFKEYARQHGHALPTKHRTKKAKGDPKTRTKVSNIQIGNVSLQSASYQRRLYSRVGPSLEGIIIGLNSVSKINDDITIAELNEWLEKLAKIRRSLAKHINFLRRQRDTQTIKD